jgi:hypothetical protein
MMVVALSAIAFSLGRIKDKYSFRQFFYTAVLAVPLGLGLVQANKLFYAARFTSNEFGTATDRTRSLSDYVEALNNVSEATLSSELQNNVAARPYIIESVGIVQHYATGHLYGKELLYDFLRVIPSAFYPGKERFLADNGAPETLWNRELGVPLNDYANTLILDG